MFDSFFSVGTQGASRIMVFCDSAEMGIQLNVVCPQSKDHYLLISFQLVDGVFSIWFADISKHRPTLVTLSPSIMPFDGFI